MHGIYASWLGWNAAEKEAVMTEQFVVPHVLLCHIQTWHLYLSCQMSHSLSKCGILFRGFSCQFFTDGYYLLQSDASFIDTQMVTFQLVKLALAYIDIGRAIPI